MQPGRALTIIKMPYTGEWDRAERSAAPEYLAQGGLEAVLRAAGIDEVDWRTVSLSAGQERAYGAWNRVGIASGNLAALVAEAAGAQRLVVGLLGNCTSLLGMLAGLQRTPRGPRGAGLLFIDAHADFNTPETTLSGMLGGMPVAVAAGLCLANLRRCSGLDTPIPIAHILMAGVRDVDPMERELLERWRVAVLGPDDLRGATPAWRAALARLRGAVDALYVHVDMDVLDPAEVGGHPFATPGGPSSAELAEVLREVFRDGRAAALGIASAPAGDDDPNGAARAAAHRLIVAAMRGALG